MTYNTKIVLEQGGSVQNVGEPGYGAVSDVFVRYKTGACQIHDAGASFLSAAHVQVQAGASMHVDDGASLVIKDGATTHAQVYPLLNVGLHQIWYTPSSADSPILSSSPGDIFWVAQSASTALYMNTSNGTTGSRWAVVRMQQTALSQTLPAP